MHPTKAFWLEPVGLIGWFGCASICREAITFSLCLLTSSAHSCCILIFHSFTLYRHKMVSGRDNSGEILLHRINPLIHFHPFHPMHCYQLSLISPNAIIFIHFLQPYPFSSMYKYIHFTRHPLFHPICPPSIALLPFQPPSYMLIAHPWPFTSSTFIFYDFFHHHNHDLHLRPTSWSPSWQYRHLELMVLPPPQQL